MADAPNMNKQQIGRWLKFATTGWVGLGLFLPALAQTDWYLLKVSGQTIGEVRIDRYQKQIDNQPTQITEISHTNHLKREGTPFEIKSVSRFEENSTSGKPLKFSYQYNLNEQSWVDAVGDIQNGALNLHMTQNNQPLQGQTAVSADQFFFPDGPALQKVYRQHLVEAPGSQFNFQTMSLGLSPKVVDTQVTLLGLDELKLADGSAESMHKFEVKNPTSPEHSVYEWRDTTGKLYKAQTVGNTMEMVYASRKQASGIQLSHPSRTVQAAQGIVVSTAIAQPRQVYQAVYQLNVKQGASDWLNQLPQGGMQSVNISADSNWAQITVKQKEPTDAALPYPIQASVVLQPYLQSSPYIQADDADIQKLAATVVSGEPRAYYAAGKLLNWVYQNIVNKTYDVGFASAKDTLNSRTGDCTEHAVLLAALTRAIGIPSRVATGLLYLPNQNADSGRFVYHMWTEVWIGKAGRGEWIALDAINREAITDAARIKFSDSALRNEDDLSQLTQQVVQWMGQLDITVLQAMTPGQSVLSLSGNTQTFNLNQANHAVQSLGSGNIQQVNIQQLLNHNVQFVGFGPIPVSLEPDSPEALFTQGVEQLSQSNQSAAISAFQQALQKTTHPLALYRLGEKLFAVNMTDLAANAFQQAKHRDNRLNGLVNEWQNVLNNNNLKSFEKQGDAFMQKSQYSKAAEAYEQAEKQLASYSMAWKQVWLQDIQNKHKLAYGAALTQQNSHNTTGWIMIGQALQTNNDNNEAQKAFQNALHLQAGSSDALIGIFKSALARSDWDTLSRYEAALAKLKTTNADAANILGLYNLKTRHYVQALPILEQARRLASNKAEHYLNLVQLYEATALYQQNIGQNVQSTAWLKHAESTLRSGLTQASDKAQIRLRLGEILIAEGKPAEALALAEQVLSENPINAAAYRIKGTAQLHQNKLAEAQSALEASNILEPNNAETLVALGQVAMEQQKEAEALQLYQQAHRLDSNNEEAIASLQKSNVLGLKSSLKSPLNTDEYNYLVQIFWLRRTMLLNILESMKEMKRRSLTSGVYNDFSLDVLDKINQVHDLNTQTFSRELQVYQQLSHIKPPLRFADFHYQLKLLSYVTLDLYQQAGLSGFYTSQEIAEFTQQKQVKETALKDQSMTYAQITASLLQTLPQSRLAALTVEARINEQAALVNELVALKAEFDRQQKAEKQAQQPSEPSGVSHGP